MLPCPLLLGVTALHAPAVHDAAPCAPACFLLQACVYRIGAKNGFFCQLVDSVVDNFGGFYPELRANRDKVAMLPAALPCTGLLPPWHTSCSHLCLVSHALLTSLCVSTDMACFPPQIFSIIQEEEASFSRTLLKGIERYKKAASAARAGAPSARFWWLKR